MAKVTKKKTTKKTVKKKSDAVEEKPAKSAKKEPTTKKITVPPLKKSKVRITLVGDTPLMVNNFDHKMMKQIEEDYRTKANKTPKTKEKKIRTAEEEYEAAFYLLPSSTKRKKKYGMPAAGIKKCAVSATKFVDGVFATTAKGAFHVLDDENGLVEIKSKGGPTVDERMVRVGTFGNKKPAMRRRPRFNDWEVTFSVIFNSDAMSIEQLLNLYENAGFSVGLCEYRPENDGNYGMFSVKKG